LKQYFWLSRHVLLFMQRSTPSQACCGVESRGTGIVTLQNPGRFALLNEQSAFGASSIGDGDPKAWLAAKGTIARSATRSLAFICHSVDLSPARS
jgi:hypothetical protein